MATITFQGLTESNYKSSLVSVLKVLENAPLSQLPPTNTTADELKPGFDGSKSVFIGYGFDLLANPTDTIVDSLKAVGVTFADEAAARASLEEAKGESIVFLALHPPSDPANQPLIQDFMTQIASEFSQFITLPDVAAAGELLELNLDQREGPLDDLLAFRGIPKDPSGFMS